MQIKVCGQASGREYILAVLAEDLSLTLLEFLRKNNITIASSCDGAGVCRKCEIQDGILTCGPTVREYLQSRPDGIIFVGYL